ncbi:MAG: hypothetical protein ABIH23_04225, partial [bacterium]
VEKGNSGGKPTNIADTPTIVQRILPVAREIEQRWRLNPTDKMVNIDFSNGLDGWSLSTRHMNYSFQPGSDRHSGNIFSFRTWPDIGRGNLYLFQTVRTSSAEISLDLLLEECGQSGFAGLRVEAYDSAFRWVAECTYQLGDSWDQWPDRYRPDNVTPEWTVGATGYFWWWVGHYAIKQRLGETTGVWRHIVARPADDIDAVHGAGTWSRLNVKALRIALIASTRLVEYPLVGSFANLQVKMGG